MKNSVSFLTQHQLFEVILLCGNTEGNHVISSSNKCCFCLMAKKQEAQTEFDATAAILAVLYMYSDFVPCTRTSLCL